MKYELNMNKVNMNKTQWFHSNIKLIIKKYKSRYCRKHTVLQ